MKMKIGKIKICFTRALPILLTIVLLSALYGCSADENIIGDTESSFADIIGAENEETVAESVETSDPDEIIICSEIVCDGSIELTMGDTITLDVALYPTNVSDKRVYVSGGEEEIILHDGFDLTAKALGCEVITLHSLDGGAVKEIEVTVVPKGKSTLFDVPFIYQREKYPTGCEAVSTVMALLNCGIEITVDEFIDNYLPIAPYHYYKDGAFYGADPNKFFSGDPYTRQAYGCYIDAIIKALENLKEKNLLLRDRFSYEKLNVSSLAECEKLMVSPLVIWASSGMEVPHTIHHFRVIEYDEHNNMKETITDRMLPWLEPQHCLLLVGYDEEFYYFNDPQENKFSAYPKDACEAAFAAYGCQALGIYRVNE